VDIGQKIQSIDARLAKVERSARLSHAAIDNTSLVVKDGSGGLRGIIGVQADGTTAVNIVNGSAPPAPSAPALASILGGVNASWDGTFTGGAVVPLDWARVEVHASTLTSFTPSPSTLIGTVETAQGGSVVIPTQVAVYVCLLARNTSGTASSPSAIVGPLGPSPVVADGILDGIVTTVKLADDAVTKAKVAVGAIGTDELGLGIGNLAPDPSFEGALTAAAIAGHTDWTQVTPGNNSPTALHVDCTAGATTWKNIELARLPVLPGERHYLAVDFKTSAAFNGSGVKLMFRYENATATVLGYGVADKVFTPGAGWDRATAQVQAPTGTTTAVLLVEASACSAGEAWFDNAEVSTLVVGGKVAAGSITATEIAALTIQAGNLAADSVEAGKIAADAVTAREIAALAVTAAEIAANTITTSKLAAGSVDATALAADAITGKTITGGTVTGALIQTAATGERITLNEAGANKVIVYNSSGVAINELSSRGLLVKGSTGAILWLNPNLTYPQLQLYNAANSNKATVQVTEPATGDANLEQFCGPFTSGSYTDMVWRSYLARDFAVMERLRATATTTIIGGRLFLSPTYSSLGFRNTGDSTQDTLIVTEPNFVHVDNGRFQVTPPASDNSVILVNAPSGHTGYLYGAALNGVAKFTVDPAGNTAVAGSLTVSGIGQRVTKRRSSDATPRANTTSVTADSQITFTVDANATYQIEGVLFYSGPGDFQMGWSLPSGAAGTWHGLGNGTTVVSGTGGGGTQQDVTSTWGYTLRTESTDIAANRTYGGISSNVFAVHVRGILRVSSTGGTFALAWAQGTSNGTGTVLYTDSHIQLEKVA